MSDSVLWCEIPPEARITRAWLLGCAGADDPAWLERWTKRLDDPECGAARPWLGADLYAPCGNRVLRGEKFCARHGSRKRAKSRGILRSAFPFRIRITRR